MFKKLLDPTVLEVNLRLLSQLKRMQFLFTILDLFGLLGFKTLKINLFQISKEMFLSGTNSKYFLSRNLRYSAYRSIHIWLNKGEKSKSGRYALPSCAVNNVRAKFPSLSYTGFQKKSPVFKKCRRKQLKVSDYSDHCL